MDKSFSENDVSQVTAAQKDKTPPNFVFSRSKRRREVETTSDLSSFKEEIKSLLFSSSNAQKQELRNITTTLKEIQLTNHNIESSVAFLTAQNEEFKKKIDQLESKIREDRKYITILEDKIEDLQMGYRKSNFEIKNVPKKASESKEDLIEMVKCLSKNTGCDLDETDMKDIYRVKSKKEGVRNTPIVVETSSTLIKSEVLKICKTFNMKHKTKLCAKHLGFHAEEDTPIFITEQLTAKGSRFHFLSRDLVRSKKYKYCWTAYGKVYVRKNETSQIITIKSEAQVQHLQQDS